MLFYSCTISLNFFASQSAVDGLFDNPLEKTNNDRQEEKTVPKNVPCGCSAVEGRDNGM